MISYCLCIDCDSLQEVRDNGSCMTCGSFSVIRKNLKHEIDEPLPKPLYELYMDKKAAESIKGVVRELNRWKDDGGR